MDPPVSEAVAASAVRAATAAADPPEDPPGQSCFSGRSFSFQGLITLPKWLVVFDEPMANSSMDTLPSMTAPSFHRFCVTVDSY